MHPALDVDEWQAIVKDGLNFMVPYKAAERALVSRGLRCMESSS